MDFSEIVSQCKTKQSFLCVGLDTDIEKIPQFLKNTTDPIFEFNKAIIDATHDLSVAYKPNLAFYECYGIKGLQSLEKTVTYIKKKYPEIFLIADAKRGDIGNTSKMYAKTFFETMEFDAVTVNPYMGSDSVIPFLEYKDKWVILLALTSNQGANDFQQLQLKNNDLIYKQVLKTSKNWGNRDNLMYVVGATKAEMLAEIREIVPENFLLVPGIGAQGGSLNEVAQNGLTKNCGLIVNSSRQILYASNTSKFAEIARNEAKKIQSEMAQLLSTIKKN
ncbi:MAG: orotidine-5'-phosphate decarboxylase [Salinivirgaceae bacterium]|nr:orotidine-5'-phosphate decarboxylase [Salinivirgaceae bacterium]MDD4746954.1 orotidine-5'-phosphate decarboxylase [Salinivirgaceae bacterium]MDY0279464.1 orotidine-5'-phosphate decarboxylase [Salinivirgaceae bacterium]